MNIIAREKNVILKSKILTGDTYILKILPMPNINSHTRYGILNIVLISISLRNDTYFP